MKHFKFISNIDVTAALEEVLSQNDKFLPHSPRPEQSPPLREGRSIHLRIHDKNYKTETVSEQQNAKELADKMLIAVDSPTFKFFPECKKLIESVMGMLPKSSILGRCYIAKAVPGGTIYPHIDPGKYFTIHDRYHIVLQTNENVSFSCGDITLGDVETVRLEKGEIWVFNNKVMHWGSNKGSEDRIHIIMDVRNEQLEFPN